MKIAILRNGLIVGPVRKANFHGFLVSYISSNNNENPAITVDDIVHILPSNTMCNKNVNWIMNRIIMMWDKKDFNFDGHREYDIVRMFNKESDE